MSCHREAREHRPRPRAARPRLQARRAGGPIPDAQHSFGTNDELWASARGVRGRPFAVLRLTLDPEAMQLRAEPIASDALRVYTRPVPSADRRQLAIGVRDLQTDITRVDGL